MPTTSLMPLPKQRYTTALGTPLVAGKVYTYAAGTTNPKPTYTDAAGTTPQANPIPLNLRGEPDSPIYWSGNYRVDVRDALGNLVYSVDNYNTDPAGLWGFVSKLATAVGAALMGWANGGSTITVEQALNTLYFGITNPANPKFGAKCDGVADDTDAIKAAFAAAPSGSKVAFPPGVTCRVRAGELVINKSLVVEFNNADLKHNGLGAGSILYIGRTAATPAADVQPFYTLSRIKVMDLRISGAILCGMDDYTNGAARGTVPDVRTSVCDGLYMEDVDAIIAQNIQVRSIKGAGLVFGDKSSVRESTFANIYVLNCGDSVRQRGSIMFLSPLPSANNGIHNHIYFEHLRVVDSFWRSIEVRRGAEVAAPFGSFILEFNHCQLDNALPVGPVGPNCEMVLLEHCGWHISFTNTVILNPYGAGGGKWGFPCVRIGTDNYPNSTVERVEFINVRFQHASFGVGVQIARGNVVRFTQCSWASDPTKSRSIVVANFNAGDAYGVSSPVNVLPYGFLDATNDFSDQGPYFHDPAGRSAWLGTWNRKTVGSYLSETFNPGGFKSGDKTFTIPANTNQSTVIALKDFLPGALENDVNGSTWLVSVSSALADGSQSAGGTALCKFIDANLVGSVNTLGFTKSNGAVLDLGIQAPNGYAPGGFLPGNGNRVSVYIGNTSAQVVNVVVNVVRFG